LFSSLLILQLLIDSPFAIAIIKDGLIPYNMYIHKMFHQMSHALVKYVYRYKLWKQTFKCVYFNIVNMVITIHMVVSQIATFAMGFIHLNVHSWLLVNL
jgi:hypothetical protein